MLPRRKLFCALLTLASLPGLSLSVVRGQTSSDASKSSPSLEEGFAQPPRSARAVTWWHWINGTVTRESITADLESMKRIGLGGAQLFNVRMPMRGTDNVDVKGNVSFMTPQWRDLVQHAIKESARLGLEFSILDCEGWGEGGGPAITPSDSMQRVVWSEAQVTGGKTVKLEVPRPLAEPAFYEDIALLAFPTMPGDEAVEKPELQASATIPREQLQRKDMTPPILVMPLPMPEKPQWLRLEYKEPHTFSTIHISINNMRELKDPEAWDNTSFMDEPARQSLKALKGVHYWELQASDDGKEFRPVGRIASHGTSSIPPTRGRVFRIYMPVPPPLQEGLPFKHDLQMQITDIGFGGPRIDDPEARAGELVDTSSSLFSDARGAGRPGIARNQIVSLTGNTEWAAPAGTWTLLRIGRASTGAQVGPAEIGGLEADKLSHDAVLKFLRDGMLGQVIKDAGPLAGQTLLHVVCDSWEKGYENWTPRMREEFRKRRGYDIEPWLPVISGRVVESVEASERFMWDFRRVIADLVAENYYGTLREYANAHGLTLYAEATGHGLPTTADQLQCKGQTDVPMGEFWTDRGDLNDCKEAGSAAHIYGKTVAGAESFTAEPKVSGWSRDPYSLKAQGDLRFVMGINRFSLHRFVNQPVPDRGPGMSLSKYGSNLDRTNTWWEQGRPWMDYVARSQFLLQQGKSVADLCYFYGEAAPVDFRFENLPVKAPSGYDFDVCNAEILQRMQVENGRITLPSGVSYRALVLPNTDRMSPEVARTVQRLVKAGAVVMGPRPKKSPSLSGYPAVDQEIEKIAQEVWGDCDGKTVKSHQYGAGSIHWGDAIADLPGVGPDFASDDANLRFIHRHEGSTEMYFVSNQKAAATVANCTFRVGGLVPELWHPDTGQRESLALFTQGNGTTKITLPLDPAGSVFVVFRQPVKGEVLSGLKRDGADALAASAAPVAVPVRGPGGVKLTAWQAGTYEASTASGKTVHATAAEIAAPTAIAGPWHIEFPAQRGAPPSADFPQLASWTESTDDGVKYFSGTATYTTTFELPTGPRGANSRLMLDLGEVKNLCEVVLNGQSLGILWKPPFRVDITAAAAGRNELKLRVTNLWPNRLIGDQKLPVARRIAWASYQPYTADAPLLPSGLLGPVSVRYGQQIEFTP